MIVIPFLAFTEDSLIFRPVCSLKRESCLAT